MNTFKKLNIVLIHGAWHGGWCWEKLVPLLEKEGHAVFTPDLPGLGEDQTAVAEVSLDAYAEKVVGTISTVGEPVVLVGHSMGGIVISQAAEKIPELVSTLIYLTAFSPKDNESLLQYAMADENSQVTQNLQVNEEDGLCTMPEEAVADCFYGMCSDEDVNNAMQRLRPQALAPIATPLKLSQDNYGRIPRCYIECSEDKAVTLENQARQASNFELKDKRSLRADHSPFYSCPGDLCQAILELAE